MNLAWLIILLLTGPCNPAKNTTFLDQRLYLGVFHGGGVEGLEKVVERALSSAGPLPLPLTPLYLTSPQPNLQQSGPVGYGSSQLRYICSRIEGRHIVAILVLTKNGAEVDSRLAAAVSSTPLLWSSNAPFQQDKLGKGEIRIDAGAREAAWALRSLLVTSHWHSYTLLENEDLKAWSTVYKKILSGPPLSVRRVPLPKGNPHEINRVLTWVSQATRGVIAVATDSKGIEDVMKEAKKLNMVSGDYVWVWLDTGPSVPQPQRIVRTDERVKRYIYKPFQRRYKWVDSKHHRSNYGNTFSNHFEEDGIESEAFAQMESSGRIDKLAQLGKSEEYAQRDGSKTSKAISQNQRGSTKSSDIVVKQNTKSEAIPQQNLNGIDKTQRNKQVDIKASLIEKSPKDEGIRTSEFNKVSQPLTSKTEAFAKSDKRIKEDHIPSRDYLVGSSSDKIDKRRMELDEKVSSSSNVFYSGTISPQRSTLSPYVKLYVDDIVPSSNTDFKRPNTLTPKDDHGSMPSSKTLLKRSVPEIFADDISLTTRLSEEYVVRRKRYMDRWKNATVEWHGVRRLRELPQPISMPNMPRLPIGLLAIRRVDPSGSRTERLWVRGAVRLVGDAIRRAAETTLTRLGLESISFRQMKGPASCYNQQGTSIFTTQVIKELRKGTKETLEGRMYESNESSGKTLAARFQILNLLPEGFSASVSSKQVKQPLTTKAVQESTNWRSVGEIVGCCDVRLERIVWPGGNIGGPCGGARTVVNVVTALAAPFVMATDVLDAKKPSCLRGIPCRLMREYNGTRYSQKTMCCYGYAMDLLRAVADDLQFDYSLYTVPDNMFGSKVRNQDTGSTRWSGLVGDLISGHAHLAFTAFSLSRQREQVIDFSTPFYFGGVSFLAAPKTKTDVPLLAFLLPFSPQLWIAIFTSLNVTAVAVAIYEWLSPFGLNPWGRQRTKNFSMSSALWVCWGLLCGHLVAFKAPKSWPNKFLINVWGGFSVIFVASYTANIAALIAGLFFQSATATYDSEALLWQRVGAPRGTVAEQYVHRVNQLLWDHMQRYNVPDIETGVQLLRNGTLDFLIADTPILDYYRATDPGCNLQKVGDPITEDAYSIGMTKGFPLKDSISAVISKFYSNGFMDLLQDKYFGGLACFKADVDVSQPTPLGVSAVMGVFLLLGLGMIMGILILIVEHLFYRYTLPILRHKPKGTIWKSRNIMFFSQKLYRFINCVELVSPHHAARELVHTIRQGQITSLFQKSVKRKEHEQRRRRKSKAQFFEMIQEIRRVQQEEKQATLTRSDILRPSPRAGKLPRIRSPRDILSPSQERRMSRLPARLELARRFSKDVFRSKSQGNLSLGLRRMSSENSFGGSRLFDSFGSQAIGRRLSRDTNLSPPDINSRRASNLLSIDNCASDISHRNSSNELDDTRSRMTIDSRDSRFHPPAISIEPPGSSATLPAKKFNDPAKKFSYMDVQSSNMFKDRMTRYNDQPELALSTFRQRDDRRDEQRKIIEERRDRYVEERRELGLGRHGSEERKIEDKALVHERPRISATLSYDSSERSERERHRDRPRAHKASSLDTPERPPRQSTVPTLLEQINQMQEQFPAKPKVISAIPKRTKPDQLHFSRRFESSGDSGSDKNDGERSPLDRLSKDELVNLCQIPENELKKRLIQAIKDKNPP